MKQLDIYGKETNEIIENWFSSIEHAWWNRGAKDGILAGIIWSMIPWVLIGMWIEKYLKW
jgi:hypothetical protein